MKKVLAWFLIALLAMASAGISLAEEARPALLAKEPNVTLPGELPVAQEKTKLTIAVQTNANVMDYETNYVTMFLQELGNVELEIMLFPETKDAYDKMNLMVASGSKLPDIIVGLGVEKDEVRYAWGQAGALIPLQDYYEQLAHFFYLGAEKLTGVTTDEMIKMVTSPDDNLYGMVLYQTSPVAEFDNRAWVNDVWLEKLGLDMPETSEELVAVLRAFRDQDPNGNGLKDEIPMIGSADGANGNPIRYLMNQFIYTEKGDDFFLINDAGELDVAYDKEEWRDGLRFVRSLVEEGLLSRQSFTQTYQQYCAEMAADEMTIGVGVSLSCSSFGQNLLSYSALGAIKGENGAQYATYTSAVPICNAAITADCENPALAFRFLEMCYDNDEYLFTRRYGEKDVDWAFAPPGTESIYKEMGYDASFLQINNIWGVPQNKHWGGAFPLPYLGWGNIAFAAATGQVTNEVKNVQAVIRNKDFGPGLDKVVRKLVYNDEENNEFAEIRSVLRTYVSESLVRFALGDMDIEKDWDSYLSELNKIGYKEFLEMNRGAYARMQEE